MIRNISRPKLDKKNRETLKKILGGEDWTECIQCGFKDHRALPNEHIDDDGYLDNRKFTDKRASVNYYRNHPEEAKKKLQIFCSNCNEIKKYDLLQKKWNLKHHSESAERSGKKNSTQRQEAHQSLGGDICIQCGFDDPKAMQNTKNVFGTKINYAKNIKESLEQSQCLVIMVGWKEFEKLNSKLIDKMNKKFIIDCRRILVNKKLKADYNAIGIGK